MYTIGYGGRSAQDLLTLLAGAGVRTVVDVRLRPDRSSMGLWVRAKTPDKGIEKVLGDGGIAYRSRPELGNVFRDYPDWRERYRRLLDAAGHLLIDGLEGAEAPICLLCAEREPSDCHRTLIADHLARVKGVEIVHLT